MYTCPECGMEYESGECPKCNPRQTKIYEDGEVHWVHLTTVGNEIEFEMLTALLEMGNIPTLKRTTGVDVIIGAPAAGIELLVPNDKYEEAVQLLNAPVDENNLEVPGPECGEDGGKTEK